MIRKTHRKGASNVEYGILAGLVSVVAIPAVMGMGGTVGGTFDEVAGTLEKSVSAAKTGDISLLLNPCFEGTSAADLVSYTMRDLMHECFYTYGGDDEIRLLAHRSFEIYPGAGNDIVYLQGNEDVIYYESGNDQYEDFQGKNSIVFPEGMLSTDVSYLGKHRTLDEGIAEELRIVTPLGEIYIVEQFVTTHGFSYLVFDDATIDGADLPGLVVSAQESDGSDVIWGTLKADTFHPGAGNDVVNGGDGIDTFYYTSGNDTYDGGWQLDALHIPYTKEETTPTITGNRADLTITMPDGGSVYMDGEFGIAEVDNPQNVNIYEFVFAGGESLTWDEMRLYTIDRMSTPGNDTIFAGASDDVIRPGAGNDWVQTGDGDDLVIYESGNLYLKRGKGQDVLDLTGFTLTDLTWSHSTKDGYIDLPTGARISLEKVMEITPGKGDNAVEKIVLDGGVELDESQIMEHLLASS